MTVNISYSSSAGGYLLNYHADYDTARNGGGTFEVNTGGSASVWGQSHTGHPLYWIYEAFEAFDYTVPSTDTVISALVRVCQQTTNQPGLSRYLTFQLSDWGPTLTSADWITPSMMSSGLPLLANVSDAQAQAQGTYMPAGSDALVSYMNTNTAGPVRMFGRSDRQHLGPAPTDLEEVLFYTTEEAGTSRDPALVWATVPKNTHQYVAGGQLRLSDGSWVYLVGDGTNPSNIWLRRRSDMTTYADIGSVPIGTSATDFALVPGMQTLALVADASDNLYLIGPNGASTGSLSARAYVKGAGTTWAAQSMLTASLPAFYDAGVNNVAAGWHNAGSGGTIMAVAAHSNGRVTATPGTDVVYQLLNCSALLAGTGSVSRGGGPASPTLFSQESIIGTWSSQTNETGNGLDVQVPPGSGLVGYLVTFSAWCTLGASASAQFARYQLSADGASIVSSSSWDTETMTPVKDASAKLRMLAISPTVFAVVLADSYTGYGLSARLYSNNGGSTLNRLGYIRLDQLALASMPTALALATSLAWDATYDPIENKIWIYYVDKNNSRRIMRTSINCSTYLAVGDEVEVITNVGSAGSVVQSLRTDRCARSGNAYTLVTTSVTTSGALSSTYQVDAFNQSPTAPTLAAKANFDATATATFAWTFNDPNTGDTQSSYQVDINTSAGVDVYDTGKLGTITYVGTTDTVVGNNASLVPTMPAGWTSGDLLVIVASIRNSGTGTVNTPSGWTVLAATGNLSVFGRIAKTGDTSPTVTFANGAANADTMAKMIAFRGTHQNIASIVHAHAEQLNGSALTIATPALTVTAPKCLILWCGWRADDYLTFPSAPSGSVFGQGAVATAGDDASQAWAHKVQTTAANEAAAAFTFTNTSAISRGITLALLPQPNPETASFAMPANTLANGNSYQWRVRTWDSFGATGSWSNFSTFQTSAGGNVTITSPAADNPAGLITDSVGITWSVSGTTQASYRMVVTRTDTSAVLADTGWVTSTATSYTVSSMLSNVEYQVAVTVRNAALVSSGTALRKVTPSFSTPEVPTCTVTGVGDSGYIRIVVNNPTPTGSRPEALGNRIVRRRSDGSGSAIVVAAYTEVAADGSFNDFTAASGEAYEYQVRAVAATGYTDGAWTSGSVTLIGVWISNPSDHAGTAVNFMYGRSMRSSSSKVESTQLQFSGRAYPVIEFAEFSDDTISVKFLVPNGSTRLAILKLAEAFATGRITVMLRDGRGRAMWCMLSGYAENDVDEGTSVSMSATRVDYAEVAA